MKKTYTGRELVEILVSRGFVLIRQSGSHRVFKNANSGKSCVVSWKDSATVQSGSYRKSLKFAGIL